MRHHPRSPGDVPVGPAPAPCLLTATLSPHPVQGRHGHEAVEGAVRHRKGRAGASSVFSTRGARGRGRTPRKRGGPARHTRIPAKLSSFLPFCLLGRCDHPVRFPTGDRRADESHARGQTATRGRAPAARLRVTLRPWPPGPACDARRGGAVGGSAGTAAGSRLQPLAQVGTTVTPETATAPHLSGVVGCFGT